MVRIMYDGVTPSRIPHGATLIAYYVDGRYANHAAAVKAFPKAKLVGIAVFASTNAGTILDVEKGDATPAEAPGWVKRRRALAVDPTVYCSASVWPTVKAAFVAQGVPQPHYWIAHYDGITTIPAGAIAKQYHNTAGYDVSSVASYWPGVDPKPKPKPPAKPKPSAYEPFPGAAFFKVGRKSPVIAAMHKRLIAVGCNHYRSTKNTDVWGSGDIASYKAYQKKLHYSGLDADGIPGVTSWVALKVPNS